MPSFVTMTNGGYLSETYETTADPTPDYYPVKGEHSSGRVDFSSVDGANYKKLCGTGFYTTCFTCNNHYSIKFVDSTITDTTDPAYGTDGKENVGYSEYIFKVDLSKIITDTADAGYKPISEQVIDRILEVTGDSAYHSSSSHNADFGSNPIGHYTWFIAEKDTDGNATGKMIVYDERDEFVSSGSGDYGKFDNGVVVDSHVEQIFDYSEETQIKNIVGNKETVLQIGETSNSSDKLKIVLDDLHTDMLFKDFVSGVNLGADGERERYTVNISNQNMASVATDEIKRTINYLSSFRAKLGAQYNRLNSTINTNLIVSDNVTNAKSRIMDTDYAEYTSEFTKSDILNKVSISMIHQSNNLLSEALKLLSV